MCILSKERELTHSVLWNQTTVDNIKETLKSVGRLHVHVRMIWIFTFKR